MQALVLVVLRLLLLRLVVGREGCRSLCAVVGAALRTVEGLQEEAEGKRKNSSTFFTASSVVTED